MSRYQIINFLNLLVLITSSLIPERFTIDFAETLSSILDEHPSLRAMIIRPLPRPGPGPFGAGLTILTVSFSSLISTSWVDFQVFIPAIHACNGYTGCALQGDASLPN